MWRSKKRSLFPMSIECSLYGTCKKEKLKQLRIILERITGNQSIQFCVQEIYFIPTIQTEQGKQRNDDVVLCLQSNVLKENSIIPWNERSWTLIQRNHPEPPKSGQQLANHRIVNQSEIQGNVLEFMELLGYTFSHELMSKGYRYQMGVINIDIFKSFTLKERHSFSGLESILHNDTWILQAHRKCNQDQVKQTSFQLFQIAQHIKATAILRVVDHALLQSKIKYT
jgi:hypothetical protein